MGEIWKSYCGWCRRVICEGDNEKDVRWALFEHYLLQHPARQPYFHIKEEAWMEEKVE